jgi:Leucine-rich repeat (LRR) protein
MIKTKTHITRAGECLIIGLLMLLAVLWSALTSSAHAQPSTLHANCLGTGWLSPTLTGFLNTKFATNWWVQKQTECVTDVQLIVTASWSLLSGNIMYFNATVVNSGVRWSYNSKVTLTLNQGLIISGWSNTLNYSILAPGASQTLTFTVLKSVSTPAIPSTGVTATATFVLADPTINDLITGNNTVVLSPTVRWSTRPICYSPTLNIPNYECDALMDLFSSTNSTGWTSKTNWGSSSDVESWYGIDTTQKMLLWHYSFESNSNSLVVPSYHWTTNAWVTFSAGKIWNAATFSSSNLGVTSSIPSITWDQTICMWIKADDLASRRGLYAKWYWWEWSIVLEPNGSISYYYGPSWWDSFPYAWYGSAVWSVVAWQWTHACLVRDLSSPSKTVKWYINGSYGAQIVAPSSTNSAIIAPYSVAWVTPWVTTIGRNYAWSFSWQIDEFRIFSRALSVEQVAQMYAFNSIQENIDKICLADETEADACRNHWEVINGNGLSGMIPSTLSVLSEATIINLNKNNLTGSLPASFGPKTKQILLANNQLTGSIPPTWWSMTQLSQLALESNNLNGAIPSQLTTTALTHLRWDNNRFTSLPDLSSKALVVLELSGSLLSWPLPSWIGSESTLTGLQLNNNLFTGPIPSTWNWLTSLRSLELNHNQLTWDLTVFSWLASVSSWTHFLVHNNNLDRDHNNNAIVPANIQARLASMTAQNLTNQWDVTAPVISSVTVIPATVTWFFNFALNVLENSSTTGAWFASWLTISFTGSTQCETDLETLSFVTNRNWITNIVVWILDVWSYAWCKIVIRDRAGLRSNQLLLNTFLNTSYGACILVQDVPYSDCAAAMDLYAATRGTWWNNKTYRRWIGDPNNISMCDRFGVQCGWSPNRITGLCLNASGNVCNTWSAVAGNNLIGTLPTSLNDLTWMRVLALQNNQLSGTLPALNWTIALTWIYLQNNQITWSLQSLPTGLQYLNLQNNQLNGITSSSWCNLTGAISLSLQQNLIVWLPACLPRFATGATLDLSSNQIVGNLSPSWSGALGILNLSGNLLTGEIPASWGTWFPSLTILSLASNNLQWLIPDSLTSLVNLTNNASYLHNNCLSPSPTYMSVGLQNTLANKFNNRWTQKNCQWSIAGEIWIDTNLNGIHDGWELGTGSVAVTLRRCADQTSTGWFNMILGYNWAVVASTSSAANGSYSFASLTPHHNLATTNSGKYYLEYTNIPNWYKFTTQFASSNWQATNDSNTNTRSAKSDCFELYNGLTVSGIDAGIRYLPYSSCDTVAPTYTPVLLGEPVTINVVWYGTNGQIIVSNGATTIINQTITNQWTNWASKTRPYVRTTNVTGTMLISWLVDNFDYKTDFYDAVSAGTAYKVISQNQRCAVELNAWLWPKNFNLTTINQIATIPAPIQYCTPAQISWLPDAAANNYPAKMLIRVPSCTSNIIVTDDPKFMCDFVWSNTAHADECNALVDLYRATNGSGWTAGSKTNWLFKADTTPKTICDWAGITCDGWWYVSTINLSSSQLSGRIDSFPWSTFTQLSGLILNNNNLTWWLPTWLVMPTLRTIRLWFNQFTGTLPTQWGTMSWLRVVSLTNAWWFSGSIPPSWSGFSNLEQLHLSNTLTGARAFPVIISSWTQLKELHLDNNGMTGAIPSTLFTLTWLQSLQLQNNDLHGDLSAQNWSALSNLYTSAYGGAKSALDNNCLYTGRVTGTTGSFFDSRFNFGSNPTTNWRNQKLCSTDLLMASFASIGNLMTWVTMNFIVEYANLGPIPSYNPIVTIQIASGLNLTISGDYTAGRTTGVRVPDLAPGQTGQYTFTINKMQLGSGFWPWLVNVFRIDDPTRSEVTGNNNLITNSIDARGSTYAVCIHPDISIQTYECEALLDLYTFTNWSWWTSRFNWGASPDVETWYGVSLVTLTGVNYVQKVCLWDETEADTCNYPHHTPAGNGNGLSGSLVSTIGDLSYLTTLNLSQNNITWALPSQMTNLDRVVSLGLYNTKLNSLGTGIATMSALRVLWATYSPNLTSLPSNLDQAPVLQILDVYNNNLTSLPGLAWLSDTLTGLNLSTNPLNITIPSWLTWYASLQSLDLSNTQLTWQVGTTFAGLTALRSLNLASNNLTWSLPSSLSSLLSWLYLQFNKFNNILPTSWSSMTALVDLNLEGNTGLTGALPWSWSGMRLLQNLNLSWWSWVGQIPSSWFASMTGMRDFDIPNASLDGPVPATGFQLWPSLKTWPITSTILNNCMYTGLVTGTVATWMNTYLNWTTQRICDADIQISLVSKSVADFNPSKTIAYTIAYANNWPRWSYEPKISIDLFTGLALSWTNNRTWTVTLPILQPGQTGQVIIIVNKRGTGSGVVTYTNTFSIADATTLDVISANNTVIDSGVMRLFKYNECIDIADVPQPECEAIMDLYTFANGANWTTKTNWAGFSDTTLCDWYGLTCSWGRVTNICLAGPTASTQCQHAISSPWGNNLDGTLLSTIGDLTELTWLFLWDNSLNGSLPTQLNNLTKLQHLSLGGNNFTSLPTLTGLQQLAWLHLWANQIAWTLPSWLGQMPQLSWVTLFNNLLTWPLPASWTGASKLRYLSLDNNPLASATLPTQWSSWWSLRELSIAWSQLTWSLPTWWSSLTWLLKINLSANTLNGTLPSSWTGMRLLQTLNLWWNQLNGSLPAVWSSLTGLTDLRLYGNPLVGASLPPSWSALTNLQTLDLWSAQLSGTLPSSWSALTNLKTLNISSNNLSDEIPSSWFTGMRMLQSLWISDNSIAWVIDVAQIQLLTGLVNNASTMFNNCLYTGTVVWWYVNWMDSYFTTLWRTQRKCNAQLQLTGMSIVGNMMSGAFMTYTFTYNNAGPSWAYIPRLTVTLYTWFALVNGGGSTTGIALWYLRPNTSWSINIPIVKTAVWSGVAPFTNTFVLGDTASNDVVTGDNTIIHTGTLTLFKYPICSSITDISQVECEALWDFYTFTNWSGWTNKTNWMWFGDSTTTTACDWYGVSCAAITWWVSPQTVDKLCMSHPTNAWAACNQWSWYSGNIASNNLSWSLPHTIADLLNITQLSLTANPKVIWTLPSNIWDLKKLKVLWFNYGPQLTWPLPASMSDLVELTTLALIGNKTFGVLPTWLLDLPKLSTLRLNGNQLTWQLPSTSSSPLWDFYLYGNTNLSWPIPAWLTTKSTLTWVRIWGTALSGVLPSFTWTNLYHVDMGSMPNLRGTLPSQRSTLGTKINTIRLAWNPGLTGTLPSSWSSLTNLVEINMGSNALTGTLPSSWSALRKLTTLRLNDNNLNGEIPSSWSALTGLTTFAVANNNIDGPIPTWLNTSYPSLGANSSTMSNNCMYTWFVSGSLLTYMNSKFGSNWQTQKICSTDLVLGTITASWSLNTGNLLTYIINYSNAWSRWAYNPRLTLTLSTGLAVWSTTGIYTTTLWLLAPWQWLSTSLSVNKNNFVGVWLSQFTNSFVLSDVTISDTNNINNSSTHTGMMRGSSYPICLNSALSVSQDECEALMDLYTATNGASWVNNSNRWSNNPNVDTWFGVSVSGWRVSKINLSNRIDESLPCDITTGSNNLSGTLPLSLSNLTSMTDLCLGNNALTGTVPAWVLWLTSLQTLSLHHSSIRLASVVSAMPSLTTLDMSYTNLSWSLSTIIWSLPSLKYLYLNNNQIRGTLSSLTSYTNLQWVRLNHNLLTGWMPSWLSTLNFLNELLISSNNLDRDHVNDAIVPSWLVSRYNSIALRARGSQWDITPPIISWSPSIPSSISSWSTPISFTINENSYTSWLYTAWTYSGQTLWWLYATLTGAWYCSSISSDFITTHTGLATVLLYPEIDGTYTSCQVAVRDRANNISNYLTLPTFTYTQPPYRLHLKFSWSWVNIVGSSIQSIIDVSSFANTVTMAWGAPLYIDSVLSHNPAIQFNNGQSLMMPGIFRKQIFNDANILMVVKPWTNTSNLLFEQAQWGNPVVLSSSSWRVWPDSVWFSLPTNTHSLITASHSNGWQHQLRVNGSLVSTTAATQPLQVSGVSVTTIGSWLWLWMLWEMIVYTSNLSWTSLNYLESYLAVKYGITLPGNYITVSGASVNTIWTLNPTYQYQVVWLGRDLSSPLPINHTMSSSASWADITLHSDGSRSNGQYVMVWANSGDVMSWTRTSLWTSGYKLLPRTWYVQKTGTPQFNISVTDNSIADFNLTPTIFVSNDPSFTTIVSSWQLVSSNGSWITSGLNIANGQYFTFGIWDSAIWGRVWLDLNRDGIQSPSEPSIAWVKVRLWKCPVRTDWWVGSWYLSNGQSSPLPMLEEQITTTGFSNYMFMQLNPWDYYMTYDWSQATTHPLDSSAWLIATKDATSNPWFYNGWAVWSDHEAHSPWKSNPSSLWYWSMSSLSGIAIKSLDSDLLSTTYQWYISKLPQSSQCYTVKAWSTQLPVWAWLMLTNSTDLSLTHSITPQSIDNVSWSQFNLSVNVNNNGSVRAHYTQIILQLPSGVSAIGITSAGNSVPYVTSWSTVKIYLWAFNPGTSLSYVINMIYDWSQDDGDGLLLSSTIMSTTTDTNASNNTPASQTLTLVKRWASVGNKVWIDGNSNGIQDSNELNSPLVSGMIVELRNATTNALVKPAKQVWLSGEYVFNSIWTGTYYVFVTNVPRWFALTDPVALWSNSTNDSNINQTTNKSDIITISDSTDNLTIDIGLKSVSSLSQCSNIVAHKMRLWVSYLSFTDTHTAWAVLWVRLFSVDRVWTEVADYNQNTTLPTLQLYNNGRWYPWWYIAPWASQMAITAWSPAYIPSKAPATRGTTGQMIISYNYLWCYVSPTLPTYCQQWFRYNSCHTYEITACGDGVLDSYSNTWYIWPNWWFEECDNGSSNDSITVINNVKCKPDCTINRTNIADLAVTKRDAIQNMCDLNPGSDGIIWWSWALANSGNRAVPVTWSITNYLNIVN